MYGNYFPLDYIVCLNCLGFSEFPFFIHLYVHGDIFLKHFTHIPPRNETRAVKYINGKKGVVVVLQQYSLEL